MAKLKCVCGNGMSNSDAPSINKLYVFEKSKVKESLEIRPKISLFEFETSYNEEHEYWYCPVCERVHVVEKVPNGFVVDKYKKTPDKAVVSIKNKCAIYVFTAVEIYDAEENDFDITLKDYIRDNGEAHLYYVDKESGNVVKYTNDAQGIVVYEREG